MTTPGAPSDEPRLSVVIPALDEEGRIAGTVTAVRAALATLDRDRGGVEIVVVDDGSSDATADAARGAGADQVLVQPRNTGKGAAVRAGMLAARGRTVAFTDADLAFPPAQLAGLLERVESGWDVVVGNRRHPESTTLVAASRARDIGGRLINVLARVALRSDNRDTQCGLKAFDRDAARLIFGHARIDGFAFDIEVFHLIDRYGLRVTDVPVEVANTTTSTVHAVRDASRLVRDLFRIRSWSRDGGYDLTTRR